MLYKVYDQNTNGQRGHHKEGSENYTNLLEDIDRLYKENDFSPAYLAKLQKTNEENQKRYIQSTLALANKYIKDLRQLVAQAESQIEKQKKRKRKNKTIASTEDKENSKKIRLGISKRNAHDKTLHPGIGSGNTVNSKNGLAFV